MTDLGSANDEQQVAAKLIERLLTDPDFRTKFRRNPGKACREVGLDDLADEMSLGAGKAMMTLDVRESKSSLAGVMMAAAMEGVAVYEFTKHVAPALDDLGEEIAGVLSHVNLPAVQGILSPGGGGGAAAAPVADPAEAGDAAAAAGGGAGGGAAAAASAAPQAPAATPEEIAAGAKPAAKAAAVEVPEKAAKADAGLPEPDPDAALPSATDLPEADPDADLPSPEASAAGVDAADVPSAAPDQPAGAPPDQAATAPAAVDPADATGSVARRPIDPSEFGLDGSGGALTPEAKALLDNPKIQFDETGVADLKAGKIDPRVVAALTKLSEKHEITVSCMCSDHPRSTAGGNISNHSHGRGVDLATIDGEIVSPGSPAAREVATELAELDPEYRPNEIGSPFAIGAPGYFTDAAHQNHVHFGFKEEIARDWAPPADVAADGSAAPAPVAGASAVAGAPAAGTAGTAPAAPPAPQEASEDAFMAQKAGASSAADAAGGGAPASEDSFMRNQPVGPPSALAPDPSAVPGPVANAAAAGGTSPLGASALDVAKTQLGVKEEGGANTGAKVDEFLAAAKVGPGNPWCASFVTWSLEQAGHKMDGSGWAAVQTWVRAAEAGEQNLQIVSAEDARPGDIVAYDWGGQDDFGSDGHIGFLASEVKGGNFTALEGNNQDQVMNVPRHTGGANVKFIRIGGTGAAPPPDLGAGTPPATPEAGGAAQVADAALTAAAGGGAGAYPGDDAPKEQIAAWMAARAEKAGLPPELPVMASLVESNLTNLDYGDASSEGYFQMLTTLWDKGEYAGFQKDPEKQIQWFIDHAGPLKKQFGNLPPTAENLGTWIADTERPAEQYRGRYALKFEEARELIAKGRASGGGGAVGGTPPADGAVAPSPEAVAAGAAAPGAPAEPAAASEDAFMSAKAGASAAPGAADVAAGTGDGQHAESDSFMSRPPAGPPGALAPDPASVPSAVADAASASATGSGALGAAALQHANGQLGVKEEGTNTGAKVDEFLAAAKVGPGNPWCASFVTWSLEQAGHKMDGSGWAAVQTWVRAAEAGTNDLQIVSPEDARPGDIVAYDWGGQDDFAADGHIGFLASEVKGDQFTALEGNNGDAVQRVPRHLGGANVKFIRIGGDGEAPAGGGGADLEPPPAANGGVDLSAIGEEYPGDDAPKQAIATWMGNMAEKRGLPRELPMMASLVESGMRNLNFGDADSVGFFQMRVGIWNKGEYAGFPDKPELQVKWFLDQAEAVKKQRIARGLPIDDPNQYGEWIADVERPAEQYRGRYQLKLAEATNLARASGGGSSPAPAVPETPAAPQTPAAPEAPAAPEEAVAAAAAADDKPDGARPEHAAEDEFMAARAKDASVESPHESASFLKAVSPEMAKAHASGASPEEAVAAQASGAPAAPADPTAAASMAPVDLTGVPADYPGDDASQQELAKWLAKEAEKAGLPPELPVMASLVESGVKNLNFGDADSVGFFQMRVGIWNQGEYSGFPENPGLQAKWFIDQALAVKRQQIARGNTDFGTDPSKFGEWIADIERPAEQYRGRYQLRLGEARKLLGS
jgi:hypothetical protein